MKTPFRLALLALLLVSLSCSLPQYLQSGPPTLVFVTANPGLLSGNVVGAIGVITKPTDEKIVKATVDYALGRRTGAAVSPPPNLRLFG